MSVEAHFHSENLILPYFSSLSMVAILVSESHRQVGSSTYTLMYSSVIWGSGSGDGDDASFGQDELCAPVTEWASLQNMQ